MAAVALARVRVRIRGISSGAAAGYLSVIMVLFKGLATVVYGLAAIPLALWARPRLVLRAASLLVVLVLAYPILRTVNLFPSKALVEAAGKVSADRAQSLRFRFDNEDQLLDWARKRIWFGWGK
jgi:hypothetical protein